MKIKFEWEQVCSPCNGDYTERAKVVEGWVLRSYQSQSDWHGNAFGMPMIFISDPEHKWEIDKT